MSNQKVNKIKKQYIRNLANLMHISTDVKYFFKFYKKVKLKSVN